jgi:hypothetical protein
MTIKSAILRRTRRIVTVHSRQSFQGKPVILSVVINCKYFPNVDVSSWVRRQNSVTGKPFSTYFYKTSNKVCSTLLLHAKTRFPAMVKQAGCEQIDKRSDQQAIADQLTR